MVALLPTMIAMIATKLQGLHTGCWPLIMAASWQGFQPCHEGSATPLVAVALVRLC